MEQISDTQTLENVQQEKLNELQTRQKKPVEDGKFIGNLGWLGALLVTIASIAVSL